MSPSRSNYYLLPLLVVLLGVLCQLNGCIDATYVDGGVLKQICSSSGEPFGFTSPGQVKELLELYLADNSLCPHPYSEGLKALEEVLDDAILSDVCSSVTYERIKEFHSRFISVYTPEATKEQLEEAKQKDSAAALEPIAESLRQFFILFAMQINAQCKRNLVERLDSDVDELVKEEDFELMKQMKYEGARLMGEDYREHAKKMKDLILLDSNQQTKLYVQVRFGDVIKKAKDACDAIFRPIYEELYVPVLRLNNLGYKDKLNTGKENENLDLEKRYTRWFGIIETCEILKDIEVLQDVSSLTAVADLIQANSLLYTNKADTPKLKTELKRITLLTEEEAQELKVKIAENVASQSSVSVYEAKQIVYNHQALAYTPRMWLLEPEQRRQEVKNFERRVKGLIHDKTSFFHLQRKALSLMLKKKFFKHKLQVTNRDESSALGRIAAFMDRHQAGVRLACAIIGLIVIVSFHFG